MNLFFKNELKSKAKLMVKEKPDLKLLDSEGAILNDDSSNDDIICL